LVQYNPKEWFGLIFRFHKSDTFRILTPAMLSLGVYAALIAFLELHVFKLNVKSTTVLHSLLGFVISLLLVFRTNTAYDRWWEARKLWGALVNNTRNLSIKVYAILPQEEHIFYRTMLVNFCLSLKHHLRGQQHPETLKACEGFDPNQVHNIKHLPNHMAKLLFQKTNSLYKQEQFSGEQFLLLKDELTSLTDITGACERIKNTPIPYSYSIFIKKFIFIYTLTIPLGLISDFGYWVAPISMFIFYALASLEVIAEEIEEPFGKESNDLPTDSIVVNIEKSITEILAI
jgi:ion channel-forming bestrophin family protein